MDQTLNKYLVELIPDRGSQHGYSFGVFAVHADHAAVLVQSNAFLAGLAPPIAFVAAMDTADEVDRGNIPGPPDDMPTKPGFWFPESMAGPAKLRTTAGEPGTWERGVRAWKNPPPRKPTASTSPSGPADSRHIVLLDAEGSPRNDWRIGAFAPRIEKADNQVWQDVESAEYIVPGGIVEIERAFQDGEDMWPYSEEDVALDLLAHLNGTSPSDPALAQSIRVDAGNVRAVRVRDDRVVAFVWEAKGAYYTVTVEGPIDLRTFDYGLGEWESKLMEPLGSTPWSTYNPDDPDSPDVLID